jgi:hypothetical protein
MNTRYVVDGRGDVIDCEPQPFNYQLEGSYAKHLLLNVVITVVLAAIAMTVGLPLVGISA